MARRRGYKKIGSYAQFAPIRDRMRKYGRRGRDNPVTLLIGVALGVAFIYFGLPFIKRISASSGSPMSLASDVCMAGCHGGRPFTVDITGRPYSVSVVPGLINFPSLPSGMTSVTGVYPPATGPY